MVAFSLRRYPKAVDPFTAQLLTRREWASIGHEHGAERAAAILAAKQAALKLNPAWEPEELEVVRREHAPPLLLVGGRQVGVRLSVAHANGLAVAAVTGDRRLVPRRR